MTNTTSEIEIQKINLKTYNTILKKKYSLSKKSYYEIIFLKFKDDIRGTWKTINDILNKIKRKKSFPYFFKEGEIISTNKSIITNQFNSFFTNIGLNLSAKINIPRNKNFQNYLTHKYNHNFHFQNINEKMISSIIDKLVPKNSCAPPPPSSRFSPQYKEFFRIEGSGL